MSSNLVTRFRRQALIALACGAALYLAGSLWAGLPAVSVALSRFAWWSLLPVVALTLLNYALRFVKWHYLLGRLGIDMPLGPDAWNFMSGLAMVISPGKAGEVLKPYVVREVTGAPMTRTIPALITERLTDGLALMFLAGLSVTTYAADKIHYLTIPAALAIGGLVVLSSERLSDLSIRILARLPVIGRLAGRIEMLIAALRTCTAPLPLIYTLALSLVAWGAECVGYLLVLQGFGIDAPLDVAVFLYAFATVAGAAMPGGLGVAESALAVGAMTLIDGVTEAEAVAASLVIRIATLWLGVGMGAAALFQVSRMFGDDLASASDEPPQTEAQG